MKKSQVSTEFIFSIAIVFIALIMILAINFEKGKQLTDLKNFVAGREDCLEMANTINTLFVNGAYTSASVSTNNLITVYNNSRIEVSTNNTNKIIAQCFYTGKIVNTRYNLTGSIDLTVNNIGRIVFS